MSFNEYMESKIPGYRELIASDQLSELEELYNKSQLSLQNANNLIELAFKYPENDYENDRKKNFDAHLLYKKQLESKMSSLMNDLGISLSEENNKPMHM